MHWCCIAALCVRSANAAAPSQYFVADLLLFIIILHKNSSGIWNMYINRLTECAQNSAGIRLHREALITVPFPILLQHSSVLQLFPSLLHLELQSPDLLTFWEYYEVLFSCLLKLLVRMQVRTELRFKVVLSVKSSLLKRYLTQQQKATLIYIFTVWRKSKCWIDRCPMLFQVLEISSNRLFLLSGENKTSVFYVIFSVFCHIILVCQWKWGIFVLQINT